MENSGPKQGRFQQRQECTNDHGVTENSKQLVYSPLVNVIEKMR